jgi:hypothetical protein
VRAPGTKALGLEHATKRRRCAGSKRGDIMAITLDTLSDDPNAGLTLRAHRPARIACRTTTSWAPARYEESI